MKNKKRAEKKRKGFLSGEYSRSWNYIKESRNFIWLSVILFLVFVMIGFFVPAPEIIRQQIMDFLKTLVDKTSGMSQMELIVFIFNNNLFASFFGMVLGLFFGIYPLIAAIGNGYLVGFVGALGVSEGGWSVLLKLLPHGIFELPAVFISLGMGIKFGTFIFRDKKIESFKNYFWNSLRVFIFVVLPLLVVAAIIEGSLINYFVGS